MNADTSLLTAPFAAGSSALPAEPRIAGPSAEMRRLSAGLRVVVALLFILLLAGSGQPLGTAAVAVLLAYGLWAGALLWAESSGRRWGSTLAHHAVDVAWTAALAHLLAPNLPAIALTLVLPVLQASIGHGVRQGVTLAVGGALGLMLDPQALLSGGPLLNQGYLLEAFAVFALGPAAALLSRPVSVLQQSRALVRALERGVDPRRGLDTMSAAIVDKLREACSADLVGLVLPALHRGPALLSTAQDDAFPMEPQVRRGIEHQLSRLPPVAAAHFVSDGTRSPVRLRLLGAATRPTPAVREAMNELAVLLQVPCLVVVPLLRYERVVGHLLVGGRNLGPNRQDLAALIKAAPELGRLLESAELIDQLQEESAAHERMRIGRDLHDSAIQPYLGLKYAVEGLALGVAQDNPVRPEILALQELVNNEVRSLRELVSGLRAGEPHGDNALVPAVRRQTRRFEQLFGVEVQLDSPDQLPISRALAGAVFHMVNEALTNVRKHTPARRVRVRLWAEGGYLQLAVRDDAATVLGHPLPDFRPRSLSERSASLGGNLVLVRPDGLNTEILVTVPLQSQGSSS